MPSIRGPCYLRPQSYRGVKNAFLPMLLYRGMWRSYERYKSPGVARKFSKIGGQLLLLGKNLHADFYLYPVTDLLCTGPARFVPLACPTVVTGGANGTKLRRNHCCHWHLPPTKFQYFTRTLNHFLKRLLRSTNCTRLERFAAH